MYYPLYCVVCTSYYELSLLLHKFMDELLRNSVMLEASLELMIFFLQAWVPLGVELVDEMISLPFSLPFRSPVDLDLYPVSMQLTFLVFNCSDNLISLGLHDLHKSPYGF